MAHDNTINFVRLSIPYSEDCYWFDQNGDGRFEPTEIHVIPDEGQWEQNARAYLNASPAPFPENWQIKRFGSMQEYFAHPEKSTFELQLVIDIGRLENMPNRPGIYSELLQDLYQIKDELKYTRFQYVEASDLPKEALAIYDSNISTVSTLHNPPTAVLIHEMDHALTSHRRVNRNCLDHYPSHDQSLVSSFTFYLDYPLRDNAEDLPVAIHYDAIAQMEAYLASPDKTQPLCLSEANINASLANEVHAFQSMARYWLYQMGVTDEELKSMREGGSAKKQFLRSLQERCYQIIGGTNTDSREAYQILLHYFAEAGFWGSNDLRDFVKDTYTEIEDPGFVDSDNCIPRAPAKSSWGCGCSMCR